MDDDFNKEFRKMVNDLLEQRDEKMEHKTLSIGFIGIGVMGKSMVYHLMQDGHKVYVYNRTKAKQIL